MVELDPNKGESMFSRKRLLMVFLPILIIAAAVGYFTLMPPSTPVVPKIWEPQLPTGGSTFTLTHEDTGVLWQKPVKTAQGKTSELHVGYRDGRLGVYHFDTNEKVSRFVCYSADDQTRRVYEAWYSNDAELIRSRVLRPDGTVESEMRRQPDGTEVRDFFAADGLKVEQSINTLPDGSQRTVKRNADGTVTTTEVKAEPSEKNIGERLRDDGVFTPIFKIKLVGVRVNEWEYYDLKGLLRHKGTFTKDGGMEITLFNDKGQPLLKQTWRKSGEDWNRAFYRVSEVEVYNEQGTITARAKLNADGVTPSEIASFGWDGKLQRKDIFSNKGVPLRQEMYYQYYGPNTDIPSQTQTYPPGQPPVVLPARIVGEPAGQDPKVRVYRILGTPFSDVVPATPLTLPPLFVAP